MHDWGCIPVNSTDAANKLHGKSEEGDVDELFLNALGIRWLLFDEGSALALSLLGTLDAYLRRACKKHPYALRGRTPRPFGGINVLVAGDLWQLPPVQANAIFSNPYKVGRMYSFEEQQIQKMFWKLTDDSIQRTFLLSKSLRTGDPWLRAVLEADRFGQEPWEMYCFIHGLPTRNPGSWLPNVGLTCGNERCQRLAAEMWPNIWDRSQPRQLMLTGG